MSRRQLQLQPEQAWNVFTSWGCKKMVLRISLAITLCCVSVNVYCQTRTPVVSSSPTNVQLQKQLAELRTEITRLGQRADSLEAMQKLHGYQINSKQDRQDSIALDLTDHSFQRLDTDTGYFLISVIEVVPYLNGFKIRLSIGNPSYASYSAAKIKVAWKTRYDFDKYTQTSFEEWNKITAQEKETVLTDTLDAGSWNKEELILAPATTEQLGIVTLSMSANTVRLTVK